MKKYLAAFLTMISVAAFAETEVVDGITWEYSVSGGEAIISGYQSSSQMVGAIKIPSKLGEYSVTSIGDWAFSDCSGLTSVTLPSGVTSIGYGAFYDCSSLKSITIPSSVTSIGSYMFYGCSSLTSITIPSSVTSIGDYAFCGCSSLTGITIPSGVTSIGGAAFWGCVMLKDIYLDDVEGEESRVRSMFAASGFDVEDVNFLVSLKPGQYRVRYLDGDGNLSWSMVCERGRVYNLRSECGAGNDTKRLFWKCVQNGKLYDDGVLFVDLTGEDKGEVTMQAEWK